MAEARRVIGIRDDEGFDVGRARIERKARLEGKIAGRKTNNLHRC